MLYAVAAVEAALGFGRVLSGGDSTDASKGFSVVDFCARS